MPRIYCPLPMSPGAVLSLPDTAARHVQVLRLQPGDTLTLFDGGLASQHTAGGEYEATITRMGRSDVDVRVGAHLAVERESHRAIHLAVGMPANERMDWLVEKATELGVASIQPLITDRTVLRLSAERAQKKQQHWQSIAIAACEQCGRNQVPHIHPVLGFATWLKQPLTTLRLMLSLAPGSQPILACLGAQTATQEPVLFLSGPEGGLGPDEERAALANGFVAASLGPRVLRAETAALAALATLTLGA